MSWEIFPLGDVLSPIEKRVPSDLHRERFQYVDIGSLEGPTSWLEEANWLPVEDAPSRARQVIASGDVVFSTVRPYMKKVARIGDALAGHIASTGFSVMRADPRMISASFLFFFVNSDLFLEQILPLQRGVSYPAVSDKDIRKCKIPVPPLDEQKRIVAELEEQLGRLDAARAQLAETKTQMEQLRASTLNNMLQNLASGAAVPEVVALGDICNLSYGKALPKESRNPQGVFPAVGSAGIVSYTDNALVKDPILVVGRKGNVGSVQVFDSGCFPLDTTFVIRPHDQVNMNYLAWALRSRNLVGLDSSTTLPSLRRQDLEAVKLPVPPLDEQRRVVAELEEQLGRLDATGTELAKVDALVDSARASVLHRAFSGGRDD